MRPRTRSCATCPRRRTYGLRLGVREQARSQGCAKASVTDAPVKVHQRRGNVTGRLDAGQVTRAGNLHVLGAGNGLGQSLHHVGRVDPSPDPPRTTVGHAMSPTRSRRSASPVRDRRWNSLGVGPAKHRAIARDVGVAILEGGREPAIQHAVGHGGQAVGLDPEQAILPAFRVADLGGGVRRSRPPTRSGRDRASPARSSPRSRRRRPAPATGRTGPSSGRGGGEAGQPRRRLARPWPRLSMRRRARSVGNAATTSSQMRRSCPANS